MSTSQEREAAAATLRKIAEVLPMPGTVAAYLRGHADALEQPKPRRRRL